MASLSLTWESIYFLGVWHVQAQRKRETGQTNKISSLVLTWVGQTYAQDETLAGGKVAMDEEE